MPQTHFLSGFDIGLGLGRQRRLDELALQRALREDRLAELDRQLMEFRLTEARRAARQRDAAELAARHLATNPDADLAGLYRALSEGGFGDIAGAVAMDAYDTRTRQDLDLQTARHNLEASRGRERRADEDQRLQHGEYLRQLGMQRSGAALENFIDDPSVDNAIAVGRASRGLGPGDADIVRRDVIDRLRQRRAEEEELARQRERDRLRDDYTRAQIDSTRALAGQREAKVAGTPRERIDQKLREIRGRVDEAMDLARFYGQAYGAVVNSLPEYADPSADPSVQMARQNFENAVAELQRVRERAQRHAATLALVDHHISSGATEPSPQLDEMLLELMVEAESGDLEASRLMADIQQLMAGKK